MRVLYFEDHEFDTLAFHALHSRLQARLRFSLETLNMAAVQHWSEVIVWFINWWARHTPPDSGDPAKRPLKTIDLNETFAIETADGYQVVFAEYVHKGKDVEKKQTIHCAATDRTEEHVVEVVAGEVTVKLFSVCPLECYDG